VFGSCCWAAGSLYARYSPLPASPALATGLEMIWGGVALVLAAAVTGEMGRFDVGRVSAESWLALAYLIVFGSLIAFTAYAWLLKNASSSLLSTYAYVNPAVAVFLGWAFAGEHVGGKELMAGLVILSSIVLLVFGRGPRAAAEPIAESLAPYIRRKDAQIVEFPRPVPRLAELRRIAA
jgi:drug/metabolite transporter (DMT)-like permease